MSNVISKGPLPAPPSWLGSLAFGLPAGSVRAILAVAVLGSTAALTALHPNTTIPDAFRDLTFLILGHYFALRRVASDPDEHATSRPLLLPRGTIRFLIAAAFAAVVVLLLRRPEPLNAQTTPAIYPLMVLVGFLLGVFSSRVLGTLWNRGRQPKRIWADLRATIAILAAALLIMLAWNEAYQFMPQLNRNVPKPPPMTALGFRHLLAAIVAFYFGARS